MVECQYLKDENCISVKDNDEAKEVRKISCSNENESACCYLCESSVACDISCDFLGKKQSVDKVKVKKTRLDICAICNSKMLHTEVKLRIGGWSAPYATCPFWRFR